MHVLATAVTTWPVPAPVASNLGATNATGILLVKHGEQGVDRSIYYIGWCGGAAGWARLFISLFKVTIKIVYACVRTRGMHRARTHESTRSGQANTNHSHYCVL